MDCWNSPLGAERPRRRVAASRSSVRSGQPDARGAGRFAQGIDEDGRIHASRKKAITASTSSTSDTLRLATGRALAAPGPFAPLAYNISSGECWRLGDVARSPGQCFLPGASRSDRARTPGLTSKGRSRARGRSATSAMSRNRRSHAASPTTPHG
jgi:hypothetical protein